MKPTIINTFILKEDIKAELYNDLFYIAKTLGSNIDTKTECSDEKYKQAVLKIINFVYNVSDHSDCFTAFFDIKNSKLSIINGPKNKRVDKFGKTHIWTAVITLNNTSKSAVFTLGYNNKYITSEIHIETR
jgi:hypothetical protein